MSTTASTRGSIVLAAGLLALSLGTVRASLDNDVRYEIGAQATSPASPAGTFTHRPLMYRMLMSGVIDVADRVSDGLVAFERAMRWSRWSSCSWPPSCSGSECAGAGRRSPRRSA